MGDINNTDTSSSSSAAPPNADDDVDHTAQLSDRIGSLCDSATDADVVFLVAGQRLPAHRLLLLATNNDHFRTLLRKEPTQPDEIELADCPASADAFRALLRYVYSGRLPLSRLSVDLELGVLALAHRYGFAALKLAIAQHLPKALAVGNVCAIVDVVRQYDGLDEVHTACMQTMDRNGEQMLLEAGFRGLSGDTLCALLRRDTFRAPELKIFGAVREWCEANAATAGEDCVAEVKSLVRLHLIDMAQLLDVVRPTGFYTPDRILDVVQEISTAKIQLSNRGEALGPGERNVESPCEISSAPPAKWPGRNVASRVFGAKVEGDAAGTHDLLDNDGRQTTGKGYLSNPITDDANAAAKGIVVELGTVYIINHVKLLLRSDVRRSYRYYVEVSANRRHWERCIDHTKYDCRSWQWLYFSPRPVKYVRLVGTHSWNDTTFNVVSMEASYVDIPAPLVNGFVAPRFNVATVERSAVVTIGTRVGNGLINGDYTTYTNTTGVVGHAIGGDAIVIQLGQPCWLESMRMLVWDGEPRLSSFYVETSTDKQTWKMAVDRRNERVKSWQSWTMELRLVVYVRIVGTFFESQSGKNFCLVHFECPSQLQPPDQ